MKKEFLINVVLVLGLNLLIKVFFIFGIDRTVQNLLGQNAYGTYFAFLNLTYIFQIVNDFGIQNFNNKHIASHRQLLPKYFPNILLLKALLALFFMVLVGVSGWFLGYWQLYPGLLLAVSLNQILVALIYYLRSNISALGYYRLDSFLSILDKLMMIIIIGMMLWVPELRRGFRIEWFAWGQFVALSSAAILSFLFLKSKVTLSAFKVNIPFLRVLIKESKPYAVLGLFMAIYNRIDSVLLAELVSKTEAGIYASAFRLMDAGTMVGVLISAFLLPMFVRLIKGKEPVGDLAQMVIKLMWVVGVMVAVPVIVFRLPIMEILYKDGNLYSANVLGFLMLPLLALMWSTVNGVLLMAANQITQLNKIYFVAVLINLALNSIAIPRYGAQGAAVVAGLTQWMVTLAQFRLIVKNELIRFPALLILQIIGLPIISMILAYFLSQTGLTWVYSFILSGIVTGLVSIVLGLFSPKGLINLLKNR